MKPIAKAFTLGLVLAVMACKTSSMLGLLSSPAFAQGSDAERNACHRDAVRWCKHSLNGGPFTVAGCLAAHKASLNPKCRAVLTSHGM